jgi:DNA-binding MarR family transcriptional regulator
MHEGERGTDVELESVAAFRTQLRRFLRRTDVVTSQAGLTTQRYDLLLMLKSADREGRGVRLTDLCELLQLQQTAVTELVKRSEQAGLIDRRPSAEDGRSTLLRLTAEGERRLRQVVDVLREERQTLGAAFADLDQLFQATSG